MKAFSWYFLLAGMFLLSIETNGRSLWVESFQTPNKGSWGDEDGVTVHTDLDGIENWTLNTEACTFTASGDYVKTVGTSGGRFEAVDCNGEAVWRSSWIPIGGFENIRCSLVVRETGSGANTANKYVHVFYRVNGGEEQPFDSNGISEGNWGEAAASLENLQGDSLQLVIRLNTTYASDKVIVDDILVESVDPPLLPENLAAAGDVLINEVLFNPYPDADDFVEIVNVSEKELRTDHLFIASRDGNGELKQIVRLTEFAEYWLPGGYLLLSEKPDTLTLIYPTSCSENFVRTDLPTLANDAGAVVLVDDSLQVIDEFRYSSAMHHPLLANEDGVSLERRSLTQATELDENWTSAASLAGFATPGCPNSAAENSEETAVSVSIVPDVISPNNDGYNDAAALQFSLPESAWVVNLKIFDASGHLVESWLNNETLGQRTQLSWNGCRSDGSLLPVGVYVFWIELNNLKGDRKLYRKTVTVVDRIM